MDKYTVDLDQVLNDFEYSELTDQQLYERNGTSNRQHSVASHNSCKNSNVKHSINNVFNSLNEYLNTDITPKFKPPSKSENSAKNIKSVEGVVKNQVFCHEITEDAEDSLQQTNEGELKICDSLQQTNEGELKICDSLQQTNEGELKICEEQLTEEIDPDKCNKSEKLLEDNEQNPKKNGISEENFEKVSEIVNNQTESSIEVINENVFADEAQKDEEKVEHEEDYSNNKLNEVNGDEDLLETDEQNEEENNSLQVEEEENMKEVEEIGVEGVASEKGVVESIEKQPSQNESIKVGFDKNVDINDAELYQYLDELEKEYEEELPTDETCEEKQEENSTGSERPTNLQLPNQENDHSTKNVIDLVGDPGSTPYNNVYVNKELPPEKEKSEEHIDSEGSTSASPTFSDVSTETVSSCTPSTDTTNDDHQIEEKPSENNPEGEEKATTEGGGSATEENVTQQENAQQESSNTDPDSWLGQQAPLWIPDTDALNCMHCDLKFTVIKRRHHCRACGLVLCSKCCNLKSHLEYMSEVARVCNKCFEYLSNQKISNAAHHTSSGSESNSPVQQPNPNNPSEYCSTLPPHQQISDNNPTPSVMVPVGVLKRKGSNRSRTSKSVMFCDGIRPGSDLTNLDSDFSYGAEKGVKKGDGVNVRRNCAVFVQETKSFIPVGDGLPPTTAMDKGDVTYSDCSNTPTVVETLRNQPLTFALQANLLVHVKITNMECCINKIAWCFSTEGLINVGQDEIVILLELLDDENTVPKDIFLHINNIYMDAVKGTSVKELGLSLHNTSNFLGSKNHTGFVYVKPTFQCLQNVIKPKEPFLVGILIHRWETPWAKLFPLRLILRLGAEYRYYPSPLISNRYRDSVFVEIGHTIINLLADFRNYSYTLPQIRGLTIHMEDKNTTITIPVNRYDQVMKSMNNSSDHILAFAGNFSNQADSHLVCIQDTQSNENTYSTHAINIHNKPRKVTGASFIVFNGALKSSSGLTAKSSIVEDGLMIQIPSDHMAQIRDSLRNMKNHTIQCGCINAASDETVNIVWGESDVNFNVNVFSPIDDKPMTGIPSIRVHNGKDFVNGNRLIRWTEVFIIENEGESSRNQDPVDISKISETIAKATCAALVNYLDLLVSNNFYKIGIRVNLNTAYVAYSAGSNSLRLPPIYMESLDNELVPILHRNPCEENSIILELIFRILNK